MKRLAFVLAGVCLSVLVGFAGAVIQEQTAACQHDVRTCLD